MISQPCLIGKPYREWAIRNSQCSEVFREQVAFFLDCCGKHQTIRSCETRRTGPRKDICSQTCCPVGKGGFERLQICVQLSLGLYKQEIRTAGKYASANSGERLIKRHFPGDRFRSRSAIPAETSALEFCPWKALCCTVRTMFAQQIIAGFEEDSLS